VTIPAGLILNGLEVFLLVFVRMTGLFVIAPVFGRRNIPAYFKIGFSFFMALILINTAAVQGLSGDLSVFSYALAVIKEFIVGISIGFISYLTFTAIYIAGEVIDMQIGFGIVNVIDPASNIQIPVTSNLYFIISMLLLFAIKGHHMIIKALFDSFSSLPLGEASFDAGLADGLINVFSTMFATGIRIAAPMVAAILLADIALGVVSKMVPQMNIFVIGMPLKILLGFVILVITLPLFISVMEEVFGESGANMINYVKELGQQ